MAAVDYGSVPTEAVKVKTSPLSPISFGAMRREAAQLLAIAAPMGASNFFEFGQFIVTLILLGQHDGEAALASVALGSSYANVVGISLVWGFTEALDTVCSQAYGAGNGVLMSQTVQRGVAVLFAFLVPVVVLWLLTEPILRSTGQDPSLAHGAGVSVQAMIPGLLCFAVATCVTRWATAQGVATPAFFVAAGSALVHVVMVYIAVVVLDLGTFGAGAAWSFTQAVQLAGSLGVATWIHRTNASGVPAWHGFSREAFTTGWTPYLRLALPAYLMLATEWWTMEILAIVTGLLPGKPSFNVAVQSICAQLAGLLFMFPMSLGIATAIRIGNSLGAGSVEGVWCICKTATYLTVAIWIVVAAFFLNGYVRTHAGLGFVSPDSAGPETAADVTREVSFILWFIVAGQLFDGYKEILNGVLRGCGRQLSGLTTSAISYIVVALPVALLLGFEVGQSWMPGVAGVFLGIAISGVVHAGLNVGLVARIDFEEECRLAASRTATEGAGPDLEATASTPLVGL